MVTDDGGRWSRVALGFGSEGFVPTGSLSQRLVSARERERPNVIVREELPLALAVRVGGESLNVRAALLHVLGDLLGSLGVVVAAIVIIYTGFERADPLIAIAISILIMLSAIPILRQVCWPLRIRPHPPATRLSRCRPAGRRCPL